MIGLLQRVTHAEVAVSGKTIGQIGRGLMVLVAVHRDDTEKDVARLAERLLGYRVFADDEGRMNRSLRDISGGLLASFTKGAAPDKASAYFDQLVAACRQEHSQVEAGVFGANMKVSLTNDGPVTFWLDTR